MTDSLFIVFWCALLLIAAVPSVLEEFGRKEVHMNQYTVQFKPGKKAITEFAAPTYAALRHGTMPDGDGSGRESLSCTLYVLHPNDCEPDRITFGDPLQAQQYLIQQVPEAKIIPYLSLHGLLGYRGTYCDEDREVDNT